MMESTIKLNSRKRQKNSCKSSVSLTKKCKRKATEERCQDEENENEVLNEKDLLNCWDESEMLARSQKVSFTLAKNFVKLLNDGCTLPFIARYRKGCVENLPPQRLQELFESYQDMCNLKKKTQTVLDSLKKSKKLTPDIEKSILNAHSLSELELIYAPLKSHTLSLAERARKLGLESVAIKALNGDYIDLISHCDCNNEELCTIDKVNDHVTHIIADIIYKDVRVMEKMRILKDETRFTITSNRSKSTKSKTSKPETKKHNSKSDPETYKLYFEWKCLVNFVKPHQVLALNRGEDEKVLSVKIVIPDWFFHQLERFCFTLWKSNYWVKKGLEDAYNRLIKPWLSRQIRSELNTKAQKEAVRTFAMNLEKYLLTEPVKNKRILGLDPGFKAGCKVGVIDVNGQNLVALSIYPDLKNLNINDKSAKQLKELIEKHSIDLIGLGNGTACRETELWLKEHGISDKVPVVIVPEQGASIYSISKEAQKDHPNMDPNLISALSIARRIMDPLGELIKVDPKHLGVGLYQHDVPVKMLEGALEAAVEQTVCMVGVDLNTASQPLLRRISGLNESRAKKIIEYRISKGRFKTRGEILKVSGIGKITYQQCAGFLKVLGGTEPLDATIIHPESYDIAKTFAKKINVNIKDLTKPNFPSIVERSIATLNIAEVSKELKTDISTMELIINAFKLKSEDTNINFCKPVYSVTVQNSEQLEEGMTLTGIVRNVVPFGCFVDCGVGDNGLIHTSNMNGHQVPNLGDRVTVTVINKPQPKKLQLKLEGIL